MEEDEERCRQRRLEEALEVKSLRRIISAYLNYPEAAYEDVKRYEKCSRKLSPAHKEMSIELSLQDLKKVALHYGFEFEKEKTIEATYTANPRSMIQAFLVRQYEVVKPNASFDLQSVSKQALMATIF
ncbi:hypothetical protein LWI28_023414 [Acer negundo]|uniref:Uncharacterized protein n=1 Tax=Acer negundo TaxID=4023 RepID=A0AAD5I7X9_ACENE|nr:hypothetical protein LWI28_023414 [Acer negundo]